MLVSDFITGSAGPLAALQDANSTTWTADQRRGFLTDGVREFFSQHPETRVSGPYERTAMPDAVLNSGDEIPLDVMFITPLAEWVMWKCFGSDAKDDANLKQATIHRDACRAFFGETR